MRRCQSSPSYGCVLPCSQPFCEACVSCVGGDCSQVKGIKDYNAARSSTIVRENVAVEKAWVTTSSARRDWLFVQFDRDMDDNGRNLYECLNNLCARYCCHCCVRVPKCVSRHTHFAQTSCTGLDFPDAAHLRVSDHEEVVETLLKRVRAGDFTGTKPLKSSFSSMFPGRDDGHALAEFVLQQPQVLSVFSGADPHNLDGCGLPARARAPPFVCMPCVASHMHPPSQSGLHPHQLLHTVG